MRGNLEARLQLLGSLHNSLPRPLSRAESEVRSTVLPALEKAATTVAAQIKVRSSSLRPAVLAVIAVLAVLAVLADQLADQQVIRRMPTKRGNVRWCARSWREWMSASGRAWMSWLEHHAEVVTCTADSFPGATSGAIIRRAENNDKTVPVSYICCYADRMPEASGSHCQTTPCSVARQ